MLSKRILGTKATIIIDNLRLKYHNISHKKFSTQKEAEGSIKQNEQSIHFLQAYAAEQVHSRGFRDPYSADRILPHKIVIDGLSAVNQYVLTRTKCVYYRQKVCPLCDFFGSCPFFQWSFVHYLSP